MRLTEISYGDGTPIDGYGPGFFRVGGKPYEGGIAVLPDGVSGWDGYGDTAGLVAAAATFDVLLVGTGAEIARVPTEFRAALEEAGVGVEFMSSPQACRTYNVLLGEGRRIAVALLPV